MTVVVARADEDFAIVGADLRHMMPPLDGGERWPADIGGKLQWIENGWAAMTAMSSALPVVRCELADLDVDNADASDPPSVRDSLRASWERLNERQPWVRQHVSHNHGMIVVGGGDGETFGVGAFLLDGEPLGEWGTEASIFTPPGDLGDVGEDFKQTVNRGSGVDGALGALTQALAATAARAEHVSRECVLGGVRRGAGGDVERFVRRVRLERRPAPEPADEQTAAAQARGLRCA